MNRRGLLSLVPALAVVRSVPLLAAQPDVVAINVLLEPDSALAERAKALNARLREKERRGFALDATHVPHVTVLQQYVRREDVGNVGPVIGKVLEATPAPMQLEIVGIDASPWNGSTMVSLRVAPASALSRFQEALVAALIPLAAPAGDAAAFVRDPPEADIDTATMQDVSGFVLRRAGEKYQPHVAVGLATQSLASTLQAEPFERHTYAIAGVAVYQLGHSGTARRKLWP